MTESTSNNSISRQETPSPPPPPPPPPTQETAAHWNNLLNNEFSKESDRACVILGVALLDTALETLLKSYLVPVTSQSDCLLDGPNGTISTFSSRINICHRLGLISSRFARDLNLIRKIRNQFAHNITGCTFDDSSVRDRILELSRSYTLIKNNPNNRNNFPIGPKGDFMIAVGWMQWHLRTYNETISSLQEAALEFGYNSP